MSFLVDMQRAASKAITDLGCGTAFSYLSTSYTGDLSELLTEEMFNPEGGGTNPTTKYTLVVINADNAGFNPANKGKITIAGSDYRIIGLNSDQISKTVFLERYTR
jgi:hypothetical protein